jgi:hypothetical protein
MIYFTPFYSHVNSSLKGMTVLASREQLCGKWIYKQNNWHAKLNGYEIVHPKVSKSSTKADDWYVYIIRNN